MTELSACILVVAHFIAVFYSEFLRQQRKSNQILTELN